MAYNVQVLVLCSLAICASAIWHLPRRLRHGFEPGVWPDPAVHFPDFDILRKSGYSNRKVYESTCL